MFSWPPEHKELQHHGSVLAVNVLSLSAAPYSYQEENHKRLATSRENEEQRKQIGALGSSDAFSVASQLGGDNFKI